MTLAHENALRVESVEYRNALRAALAAMNKAEWNGFVNPPGGMACPVCEQEQSLGHTPDCQLAAAIQQVEETLGE